MIGPIGNVYRTCVVGALMTLLLAACSGPSRFDVPQTEHGPSVDSIVQRLRCEIGSLAYDDYPHSPALLGGDFVVAVQLNLTVNDDGSLAPAFTYMSGPFSFNLGAKLEASREQNYTQNLIFSIRQLRQEIVLFAKEHLGDPFPCNRIADTELAGDLGIRSAVNMAFGTSNNNFDTKLAGTNGAFGGYVTFTITKNLNAVGPTWNLVHFKGPGSFAGVSEVNTDKIAFAFAQSGAAGKVPATNANVLLDRVLQAEIATQLNAIRANTH